MANSLFRHKLIHKWTWRPPGGGRLSEIDLFLIKSRCRTSLLDTRAFRGAAIGSDHTMVLCRLRLRLATSRRAARGGPTPNLAALEVRETRESFQAAISNAFESLDQSTDSESQWVSFRDTVVGSALRTCGKQPRNSHGVEWLTPKVLELMTERDAAHQVLLQNRSPENLATYKRLRNRVTSALRKAERQWYGRLAANVEAASREGRTRDMFRHVKSLQPRTSSIQIVKDKDDNALSTAESRRERWREHFSELLNLLAMPDPAVLGTLPDLASSNMEAPLRLEEVQLALKELRSNRAPGIDSITAELLRAGGPALEEELFSLLTEVWNSERIPKDWSRAIIVAIFKKGDRGICGNHRGLSLLSVVGKVFTMVLLKRLTEQMEPTLLEEQCGFRRGRSTMDHIFTLRLLVDRCWEFRTPLHMCFVDLKQAYDTVWRNGLWEVLRVRGVRPKLLRLIQALYKDTTSCVRSEGDLSEWFSVEAGVRQGCVLSPLMFNIFFDFVIRRAIDESVGLQIGNTLVSHLEYADDLSLISSSFDEMNRQLMSLATECARWGLSVSVAKTKVLTAERVPQPYQRIFLEGTEVERVEGFCYLGHWIAANATIESEVQARINRASRSWGCLLRSVMGRKQISGHTKCRLFAAVVIPSLTYGAETWPVANTLLHRLDVFQSRCLRRIWRINWWDHVRTEDVLRRSNQTPISEMVRRSRLRWLGHVLRMSEERIPRRMLGWTPGRSRPPGRPRTNWVNVTLEDLQRRGIHSMEEAANIASDRATWRAMAL